MKRLVLLVALLLLAQLAAAANESNGSVDTTEALNASNDSGAWLPDINTTQLGEKFENATETGVGPLDQAIDFLSDASPFLLLIIGILLIVMAGFGKIIGIILIVLALIRLIWVMFF